MRSGSATASVALLLAVSWAGCLSDPATLTEEEAPEGPRSLRVGTAMGGDYSLLSAESTSVSFDDDGLVTKLNRYDVERRIKTGARQMDAFYREVDVVEYQYQINKLTAEPGEPPRSYERVLLELASGRAIASQEASTDASTNCVDDECSTEYRSRDALYFHRSKLSDRWDSLEGQVLKIGRTLSLSQDVPDLGIRVFHNVTTLREDSFAGERAFVVEPSFGFEITDYQKAKEAGLVSDERPQQEEETEDASEEEPLPESTNLVWYTATAPLPVKTDRHFPFRYENRILWFNSTTALQKFEAGTVPIAWGSGTPVDIIEKTADGRTQSVTEALNVPVPELAFDLPTALSAAKTHPWNRNPGEYYAAHPEAQVRLAIYLPSPDRDAAEWQVFVASDAEESLFAHVRRTTMPLGLPPRDDVSSNDYHGSSEVSQEAWIDVAQALRAGFKVIPQTPEVGVAFQNYRFGHWTWVAATVFETDRRETVSSIPTESVTDWVGENSVSVSLSDGGLLGLNVTRIDGRTGWSLFPSIFVQPHIEPALAHDPTGVVPPGLMGRGFGALAR